MTEVRTHAFVSDGRKDWVGETRCVRCGLPLSNRRHAGRVVEHEQAEHRRRTGEES